MASSAGSKAVAVVVDDAAVAPQYVRGFSPARELPIIWKITKGGSLLNKAILIVLLLLLDQFLPFVLTPLLMLGGSTSVMRGGRRNCGRRSPVTTDRRRAPTRVGPRSTAARTSRRR